ncbi:MAG: prepilin-type N-terminal cleavage/methylation domain-containing protein [Candidatus Omnitrophota bacterium]
MKAKGFTLIELLIVFLIIAILVGAMVPMFRTTKLDAQATAIQKDLEAIKTACQQYHFDVGKWPAALETSPIGLVQSYGSTGW